MNARRAYLRFLQAVAAVYLLIGVLWTALNLGDIPHYGDTVTYFRYAQDVRVNEHRGIVYPFILAQSVRFLLDGKAPGGLQGSHEKLKEGRTCTAPAALGWIQVFQILVGAGSIFYFLRLTLPQAAQSRPEHGRAGVFCLFLLLLFDPQISHFGLALMTDGLTLSACLLFCGASIALANRRSPPWLAGAVLGVGFLLASGLRVEKKWILLATFLSSSILFMRYRTFFPEGLKFRSAVAGTLLASGLLLTVAVQGGAYEKDDNLSSYETFVHLRIGFQHLGDVYDELPERTRARLSREDAKIYDGHVNGTRRVVKSATGKNEQLRRELTRDILETVLPRRWGTILLDVARDAVENTLSTFSFYIRVAAWHLGGRQVMERWFSADGSVWNYTRMASHHPSLTRLHLALAALVLLLALPLALQELLRRRPSLGDLLHWAPCVVFCLVNAVFFAAIFNHVNSRYTIFAHAFFLILVYRPAIRAVLEVTPRKARIDDHSVVSADSKPSVEIVGDQVATRMSSTWKPPNWLLTARRESMLSQIWPA